jgi:hypothetical protein
MAISISKIVLAFGSVALLASCANTYELETDRAKSALIDLKKSQLFECAGLPDKDGTDEKGTVYLNYRSEKTVHVPAPYPYGSVQPFYGFSTGHRSTFGARFGYPSTIPKKRSCNVTFSLDQNRVKALEFRSSEAGNFGREPCYQIIRQCLAKHAPKPQTSTRLLPQLQAYDAAPAKL